MVYQSQFIEMFGCDPIGDCQWPTKTFGELFDISSSRRILKDDWAQEGVPFLRVRDLIHYSQTGELRNEFFVSESFYNKLKDTDGKVQAGDILVSATSTIGKCMIVQNGEKYYYKDADVLRFREKEPVNKVFFIYGIAMPTVENQINDTIGKTTVGHFLISKAATIKQPLPPIALQEAFERVVNQADKSKFDGFKSQFIEMFGVLQNNTLGFPVNKLGDIAFITKLAGFEYTKYIHYKPSGDIIMIRGLNCKNAHLVLDDIYWIDRETSDFLERSKLHKGDIVLTYVGTVGEVALIDEDNKYHLAPNVAKVSLLDKKSNNPEYWTYALMFSRDYIMHFAASTSQAAISMEKIRDIVFPIPPRELQEKIIPVIHQADKSKYLN